MGVIAVLLIIFIAFKIMFTRSKGSKIFGSLIWLLVGMIMLGLVGDIGGVYSSLSPLYRLLLLLLAFIIIIRIMMTRETMSTFVAHVLHDVVMFLLTLPFKAGRLVFKVLFRPRQLAPAEQSNDLSRTWVERNSQTRGR